METSFSYYSIFQNFNFFIIIKIFKKFVIRKE